jgi:hypothetical protein
LDEEEIPVKRNTKNTKTTFKEDFPALSGAPTSGATISVGTTEAQNSKKRSYAFIAKTAHEEAVQEEIIIEYNNLNTPDTFNSSAVQLQCASTSDIYKSNTNKLGIKKIEN